MERRENEKYPALKYARLYHRNTRNQPMDFSTRPYLVTMYKSFPRPEDLTTDGLDIVIQKCVQMGISEAMICAILAYAGEYARAVLYVLPKFDLKYTFTRNRIDKPIARVEYYRQKLREMHKGAKSVALKDFGQGVIKVVGSNVETEFVEFPADVVVIDEADLCDQTLIPIAKDRLKGPGSLRIHVKLGNPTISSAGLHDDFKGSTRMEWYVPCPKCHVDQEVRFFGNVMAPPAKFSGEQDRQARSDDWRMWELRDRTWTADSGKDIKAYCRECGSEMDRLADGQWWEENPGSRTIGFHMSKLMDPTYPIHSLYKTFLKAKKSETDMQTFFNFDLGVPYTSFTAQLSKETLRTCIGTHRQIPAALSTDVRTVMGVDVGTVLHFWIETVPKKGQKPIVIRVDYCADFEQLKVLMETYNVACCVIDARPEGRESKKFSEAYRRGRVWRCDYEYHGLKDPKKDWQERLLKADRTISMDESHGLFIEQDISLPQEFMGLYSGEVVEQMCSSVRVKEIRPSGQEVYVWDPKGKADHWRHAQNYATLAQKVRSAPMTGVQA